MAGPALTTLALTGTSRPLSPRGLPLADTNDSPRSLSLSGFTHTLDRATAPDLFGAGCGSLHTRAASPNSIRPFSASSTSCEPRRVWRIH